MLLEGGRVNYSTCAAWFSKTKKCLMTQLFIGEKQHHICWKLRNVSVLFAIFKARSSRFNFKSAWKIFQDRAYFRVGFILIFGKSQVGLIFEKIRYTISVPNLPISRKTQKSNLMHLNQLAAIKIGIENESGRLVYCVYLQGVRLRL